MQNSLTALSNERIVFRLAHPCPLKKFWKSQVAETVPHFHTYAQLCKESRLSYRERSACGWLCLIKPACRNSFSSVALTQAPSHGVSLVNRKLIAWINPSRKLFFVWLNLTVLPFTCCAELKLDWFRPQNQNTHTHTQTQSVCSCILSRLQTVSLSWDVAFQPGCDSNAPQILNSAGHPR